MRTGGGAVGTSGVIVVMLLQKKLLKRNLLFIQYLVVSRALPFTNT